MLNKFYFLPIFLIAHLLRSMQNNENNLQNYVLQTSDNNEMHVSADFIKQSQLLKNDIELRKPELNEALVLPAQLTSDNLLKLITISENPHALKSFDLNTLISLANAADALAIDNDDVKQKTIDSKSLLIDLLQTIGAHIMAQNSFASAESLNPEIERTVAQNIAQEITVPILDEILPETGHPVAFSYDGKQLASVYVRSLIKIWDLEDKKLIYTLRDHYDPIASLEYNPLNSNQLASCRREGWAVDLYDTQSGQLLFTIVGMKSCMAFSPLEAKLALGSIHHNTIELWNPQTPSLLSTLNETNLTASLTFSNDGRQLISLSHRRLNIWDSETCQFLNSFESPMYSIFGTVKLRPRKGQFISFDGNEACVISAETYQLIKKLEKKSLEYSHDGNLIYSCEGNGKTITIMDADNFKFLESFEIPKNIGELHSLKTQPLRKQLAAASYRNVCLYTVFSPNIKNVTTIQQALFLKEIKDYYQKNKKPYVVDKETFSALQLVTDLQNSKLIAKKENENLTIFQRIQSIFS